MYLPMKNAARILANISLFVIISGLKILDKNKNIIMMLSPLKSDRKFYFCNLIGMQNSWR